MEGRNLNPAGKELADDFRGLDAVLVLEGKWRNLLVDDRTRLFLIDCPNGDFWRGFWLRYRFTKDLACLDKVAKHYLSQTQRLRFYLQYCQRARLDSADKKHIRHVLRFFEGRE